MSLVSMSYGPASAANERDMPLSGCWSGVSDDHLHSLALAHPDERGGRLIRSIITNLLVAEIAGSWVSYSRNKEFYPGLSRYEGPGFTYRRIIAAVESLKKRGLIIEQRAKQASFGWQSRMRASPRLLEIAAGWGPLVPTLYELIHLKDEHKRRIDYRETEETLRMRHELEAVNEALAALTITSNTLDLTRPVVLLRGGEVATRIQRMHRCFNRDFRHGGRFYGPFWQNCPKDERAALRIDGCPVTEHDYAQLHPQLLYAHFGLTIPGDAYTIEGVPRGLAKIAWQILMNSSSRREGRHALLAHLKSDEPGRSVSLSDADRILDLLERRHAPVRRAFYSGVGLKLQLVDSNLIIGVLVRCLSEGFVGLPVHDSLIVRCGAEADVAKQIMDDELAKLLRKLRAC